MNKSKLILLGSLIIIVSLSTLVLFRSNFFSSGNESVTKNYSTTTTGVSYAPSIYNETISGFNLTAELNLNRVHYAGDIYLKITLDNFANTSNFIDPVVGFDVNMQMGQKVYGFETQIYGNDSNKVFKLGETWTSSKGLHWKAIEDPVILVDVMPETYIITVYAKLIDASTGQDFIIRINDVKVTVTE